MRATAIAECSTASQVFLQPPSGWTSTVEPTDGVYALVRAVVLQRLTLVDVLARVFLFGERVSLGTHAFVRSFEIDATFGTTVTSVDAFVNVDATTAIFREFKSSWTLADVRSFVVLARETAVVRLFLTFVDIFAGRAVLANFIS